MSTEMTPTHTIITTPIADASDLILSAPSAPDAHPGMVYLAGLSKTGRRSQAQVLNLVADVMGMARVEDEHKKNITWQFVDWSQLRYQHLQAIRTRLQEHISKRTGKPLSASQINKALSAIRGTLKAAWLLGNMSAEDYHKAASVKSVSASTVPSGRDLSTGEIGALMSNCDADKSAAGVRDAAILACMYPGGMRRAEITALTVGDVTVHEDDLISLTVRGKRNKERVVWLDNGGAFALLDWLAIRADADADAALFVSINKAGVVGTGKLTTQAIYKMLTKRAESAGVNNLSPHDFRRTVAGNLLDAGADIATVANILGHASIETTKRYDRRGERAKRQAISKLHLPYTRRGG